MAPTVDLVNELGTIPRREAGEQDDPHPDPRQLAAAHSLPAADAQRLLDGADQAAVVAVADRLHAVIAAAAAGRDAEAVATLNALLADSAPQPRVALHDGAVRATWAQPAARGGGHALLAACALALREALAAAGTTARLGVCQAHGCADVYLDASRGATRRYCSPTCASRAKVAAFRARRRGQRRSRGRQDRPGRRASAEQAGCPAASHAVGDRLDA
ncbi:MAG TPA: CGNR zinc finger domain-containing protein [Egibacteraceae bacterium]